MNFMQFLTTLTLIYAAYYALAILIDLVLNNKKSSPAGNTASLVSYELKEKAVKPQTVIMPEMDMLNQIEPASVIPDLKGRSAHYQPVPSLEKKQHKYNLLNDLGLETISGDGIELTAESLSALMFDDNE